MPKSSSPCVLLSLALLAVASNSFAAAGYDGGNQAPYDGTQPAEAASEHVVQNLPPAMARIAAKHKEREKMARLSEKVSEASGAEGAAGSPVNNIGSTQVANDGTNIKGNNNDVLSLVNLDPLINADANILTSVVQTATGGTNGVSDVLNNAGNNIGGKQTADTATNIAGHGNTVSSLANLDPLANVDLNLLNSIRQVATAALGASRGVGGGVLGGLLRGVSNNIASKPMPSGAPRAAQGVGGVLANNIGGTQIIDNSKNIEGNNNVVSSLVNVDPTIGVGVNLLNDFTQTAAAGQNGALVGLLGGASNNIGGTQISDSSKNIKGDNNDITNLVNVDPQIGVELNLLNKVSQGVNGGSGSLLGGLLGGASNNIGGTQIKDSSTNIKGSGNKVSNLVDVGPQVNAEVNLLNSVSQLANSALGGSKGAGEVLGPVLNNAGNNIGGKQISDSSTNIDGNNNDVFSLLNVDPQIGASVNVLNQVSQLAEGLSGGPSSSKDSGSSNNIGGTQINNGGTNLLNTGGQAATNVLSGSNGTGGILDGVLGNAVNAGSGTGVYLAYYVKDDAGNMANPAAPASNNIGSTQTQNSGANIEGSGNTASSLVNLGPQIDLDINLLNTVSQLASSAVTGSKSAGSGVAGALLGGASNNVGGTQIKNDGTNIKGNGNTVSSLLNVGPQVNADVNVLDTVSQTATSALGGSKGPGGLLGGVLGSAGGSSSPLSGVLGGASNNIGGTQIKNDGTNIKGNGNTVSSLLNVGPQVNADVNVLDTVSQTATSALGGSKGPGGLLGGVLGSAGGSSSPLSGVLGGASNNIGGTQIKNDGTNIKGNGNTVSSLLNVGPQVNADVNVLDTVSQTATSALGGSKGPGGLLGGLLGSAGNNIGGSSSPLSGVLGGASNNIGGTQIKNDGTNIKGNGNTVSSLLNVGPQVNADVNVLDTVSQTATSALGGSKGPGGLLGGLLGSAGNNIGGSSSPLSGVLGGASNNIGGTQIKNDGTNIKGNANTVSSLLNVGPQVNADVNVLDTVSQTATSALGGSKGQGGLLGGVLGSAGGSSSPLSGVLGGASNNIGGTQIKNDGTNIKGNGNTVSSLLNVGPQVNADVNVLDTVSQTATSALGGSKGLGGLLGGVLGSAGNNIGGSSSPLSGVLGGASNNIGGTQIKNDGTNIKGNANTVSSLLNVGPQVNADVNVLDTVAQTATSALGGSKGPGGLLGGVLGSAGGSSSPLSGVLGGASNNIGGTQIKNDGTNIKGNGNTVSSLLNVGPQVNADVNVLDTVSQTATSALGGSKGQGGLLGGVLGSAGGSSSPLSGVLGGASNNIGGTQIKNDGTNIKGNENTVSSLLNVGPQVNADVNVLDTVSQTATSALGGSKGPGGLLGGVLGSAGSSSPVSGSAGNNIGGTQIMNSGQGIVGENNAISSLLNVDPQVNAGVNVLNSVIQKATGASGGGNKHGGKSGRGGGRNNFGTKQISNGQILIVGDNNEIFKLADVSPQIAANINLLTTLLQNAQAGAGGVAGSPGNGGSSSNSGSASNNFGSQQIINDGTVIRGNNNQVSSLGNVNPQIGLDLNLLNQVTQLAGVSQILTPGGGGEVECDNNIGNVQQQNSGTNIVGDGNEVFSGLNVNPQINAGVNLLNTITQNAHCRPKVPKPSNPTVPPTLPPTAPSTPPPTLPPVTPPYVCIEVGGADGNNIGGTQQQNSGTNIDGDGNQVFSLLNINPQVNLGVNLLNNVQQITSNGRRLICIPIVTPPPVTTPLPPTKPTVPPTKPPTKPTVPPTKPPTKPTVPPTKPPTYPTLSPTKPPTYPTLPPTKPPTYPTLPPTKPPTYPTVSPTKPPTLPPITPPYVCIEVGGASGNNNGGTQIQNSGTNIDGDGNQVLSLLNLNPQVNLGVNLLNNVQQITTSDGRRVICIPIGTPPPVTTPLPPTKPTVPPTKPPTYPTVPPTKPPAYPIVPTTKPPTKPTVPPTLPTKTPPVICEEVDDNNIGAVQGQNSGTNIVGDGNEVFSLLNLNPQVNLGVNVLNDVLQTSSGGGSGRRIVCRPITPTTPPIITTRPTTEATLAPRRCYKRVCRRWRNRPCYSCEKTYPPTTKAPVIPPITKTTKAPLSPTPPPTLPPPVYGIPIPLLPTEYEHQYPVPLRVYEPSLPLPLPHAPLLSLPPIEPHPSPDDPSKLLSLYPPQPYRPEPLERSYPEFSHELATIPRPILDFN